MIEGFLTTKECAEKLGVTAGRVQQFIAEGRLPATKVGHTNLVKEADLILVQDRKPGRPSKEKTKE